MALFANAQFDYYASDEKEYPMIAVRNGKIGWESSKDSNKVMIPFEYDGVIGIFTNGIQPVNGVIEDVDGERLFEYIYNWYDGGFDFGKWVKKNEKWGVIDSLGNIVIPFEYEIGKEVIYETEDENGNVGEMTFVQLGFLASKCGRYFESVFIINRNGKYGVATLDSILIPCEYDDILNNADESSFVVVKNGKYGIIGWYNVLSKRTVNDGDDSYYEDSVEIKKVFVPCVYDKIEFADSYYCGCEDIKEIYNYEEAGDDGTTIESELNNIVYKAYKNGKVVFLKSDGNENKNIPSWLDDMIKYDSGIKVLKSNGKWGVLYDGKYSSFDYDEIVPYFSVDYIGTGLFGYYFSDLFTVKKNGKYGVMDSDYKLILPCIYKNLDIQMDFQSHGSLNAFWVAEGNDSALIKKDYWIASRNYFSKWGVKNNAGETILPFEYDSIVCEIDKVPVNISDQQYLIGICSSGYFLGYKRGKSYLFDEFGKMIIEDATFLGQYIKLRQNGKWGISDKNGKKLLPCEYEELDVFGYEGNFYKVRQKGKWGIVDNNGKQIISCEYEDVDVLGYGADFLKVRQSGKWGIVDINGKQLLPCVADEIEYEYGGCAKIVSGKKTWRIDKSGKPCK